MKKSTRFLIKNLLLVIIFMFLVFFIFGQDNKSNQVGKISSILNLGKEYTFRSQGHIISAKVIEVFSDNWIRIEITHDLSFSFKEKTVFLNLNQVSTIE